MRCAILLFVLSLLLTPIVCAQSTSTASTNQNGTSVEPTVTHYSLTPDKLQKAEGLYKIIVVFVTLSTIYGFVVLLGLLRFDIGPKFRNVAERLSRFRFVQAYIFVPLVLLTLAVLNLPFDAY